MVLNEPNSDTQIEQERERIRKTLTYVSLIILVYVISGAHIGDEGKVLGQTLVIERVKYLELAFFVYFLILFYQFRQNVGLFRRLKNNITNDALEDPILIERVEENLPDKKERNGWPGKMSAKKSGKFVSFRVNTRDLVNDRPSSDEEVLLKRSYWTRVILRKSFLSGSGINAVFNTDYASTLAVAAFVAGVGEIAYRLPFNFAILSG